MRRPKHQDISDDEVNRLIKVWSKKGDAEAAIIAGSFVEDRLGLAIRTFFVKLPSKGDAQKMLTEAELFDGYGPLSNFFGKVDIGCALGLYTTEHRNNLHIIRSIRNAFAHTIEAVSFLDEEVVAKLKKISWPFTIETVRSALKSRSERSGNKHLYISACASYSGYLIGAAKARLAVSLVVRPPSI